MTLGSLLATTTPCLTAASAATAVVANTARPLRGPAVQVRKLHGNSSAFTARVQGAHPLHATEQARSVKLARFRSMKALASATTPSGTASVANRTWSKTVRVPSGGVGCHLVTAVVLKQLPELKEVTAGLANFWLKDTTASLSVNENADPTVRTDLEGALQRIMPAESRSSGAAAAMLCNTLDVTGHSGTHLLNK